MDGVFAKYKSKMTLALVLIGRFYLGPTPTRGVTSG